MKRTSPKRRTSPPPTLQPARQRLEPGQRSIEQSRDPRTGLTQRPLQQRIMSARDSERQRQLRLGGWPSSLAYRRLPGAAKQPVDLLAGKQKLAGDPPHGQRTRRTSS